MLQCSQMLPVHARELCELSAVRAVFRSKGEAAAGAQARGRVLHQLQRHPASEHAGSMQSTGRLLGCILHMPKLCLLTLNIYMCHPAA